MRNTESSICCPTPFRSGVFNACFLGVFWLEGKGELADLANKNRRHQLNLNFRFKNMKTF